MDQLLCISPINKNLVGELCRNETLRLRSIKQNYYKNKPKSCVLDLAFLQSINNTYINLLSRRVMKLSISLDNKEDTVRDLRAEESRLRRTIRSVSYD